MINDIKKYIFYNFKFYKIVIAYMVEAKSILIHNIIPFAHISDYDCIYLYNFNIF